MLRRSWIGGGGRPCSRSVLARPGGRSVKEAPGTEKPRLASEGYSVYHSEASSYDRVSCAVDLGGRRRTACSEEGRLRAISGR